MLRYRLRTLLILLAIGPPLMAGAWPIVRDALWLQPVAKQDVFAPVPSGSGTTLILDADAVAVSSPPSEPNP